MERKSIYVIVLFIVVQATGMANPDYQIVFTQEPFKPPSTKSTGGWTFRKTPPEGSRVVTLSPEGEISHLTPEFVSACHPCVSHDGKRILFSGKLTREDRWNIWEMDIDGKNKRQITKDLGDCTEPEYLARSAITPPEFTDKVRWVVFASQ